MNLLISADELHAKIGDEGLIILDATVERQATPSGKIVWTSGRAGFEQGHIPTARFADLFEGFSEPNAAALFTHSGPERFALAAAELGVGPHSEVVIYDRADNMWAARLAWQFRALGFGGAAVLDGGFGAWLRTGGATATGPGLALPAIEPFTPRPNSASWVDRDDVLAIVEGRRAGTLICALRPPVFQGAEVNYARPGHIPGSLNAPHAATLDAKGCYLQGDRLVAALGSALSAPGPLVLYCGGGIAASGLALALGLAGRSDVSVYDGSLGEWSADPKLPLVVGV